MSTEKLRALRERLLASGIRVIDVVEHEPCPIDISRVRITFNGEPIEGSISGAFHVHDGPPMQCPPGAMVSYDPYAQALGRAKRAPVPHVPAWIELFDLQRECKTEGTNVIDVARELGDEWAAACEGWSRS